MQDSDFELLKAKARVRKRVNTQLVEHQELIKRMMDADISLPLIFDWLREKKVDTALTTLRRFINRTYGLDFYENFQIRNGWKKNKGDLTGRVAKSRSQATASTKSLKTKEEAVSKLGNPSDINNFFNSRKS